LFTPDEVKMRLTDASVIIRPRSAWEALDLGVLLARRHRALLSSSWALLTLPIFLLCSALLWQYPSLAMLLFWWLKPLYERLPLHILSQALFGATPTLKQAFQALPRLLKPQLLASLTWRRLSVTRSFDLPVLQLEGLSGQARSQRLMVLSQRDSGPATWLTIVGAHIESALYIGMLSLLYLLLPQQLKTDWDWSQLMSPEDSTSLWLQHLYNLFYAALLIVWEPIYVACGFSLYLNRRSSLEAWDLELAFRRLRQRLSGLSSVLLLVCGLFFLQPTPSAWAAPTSGSCPIPQFDPAGPKAERLLKQPLNSKDAQHSISQLLDQPPFENRQTVTRWKFGEPAKSKETKKTSDAEAKSFIAKIQRLLEQLGLLNNFELLSRIVEVILWTALFSALTLLAWRYREWLRTFGGRLKLPAKRQKTAPSQLFGLEVAPESLPDDIASAAEQLWAEQPREALGLLYRALLSRLLHDYQLHLKGSHTEAEVLQLTEQLQLAELSRFAQVLTRHWQNLAYGHQLPPANLKRGLCEGWRRLFNPQPVNSPTLTAQVNP
jgi:hypothetical protein